MVIRLQLFTDRRAAVSALIVLILTWLIFTTLQRQAGESGPEYFLNSAMAPVEQGFTYLGRLVEVFGSDLTRVGRLQAENDRLYQELKRLQAKQLSFNRLKAENDRLQRALQFTVTQPYQLLPAEVIAFSPSPWSQTLTLNRGRDFGLRRNMVVIAPAGIVGRISNVRAHTAAVLLLTDPREGNYIAGVVERTQTMVLVHGGGFGRGVCTVKPALESYSVDLVKGDLILTAANSTIYPRGLPIGTITRTVAGSDRVALKAVLRPAVELGRLGLVYVIKQ